MLVVHYTDPACPFAFSAEPQRWQLRWHYGEQLEWRTVMVGLAESGETYRAKGYTTAKMAAGLRALQVRHGMPIDVRERPRLAGTMRACRAVVAARLHDPPREEPLLRRLRIRTMAGELLDSDEILEGAALDVGLEPADLLAWMAEPATEQGLLDDLGHARTPHPAALLLDHKLAPSEDGGRRYTCPSYELRGDVDTVLALPGFQPWETYDAAVANAMPAGTRRGTAEDVVEVLEWAGEPLATAEVAALRGIDVDAARAELEGSVATFAPVGEDGYWTLSPA